MPQFPHQCYAGRLSCLLASITLTRHFRHFRNATNSLWTIGHIKQQAWQALDVSAGIATCDRLGGSDLRGRPRRPPWDPTRRPLMSISAKCLPCPGMAVLSEIATVDTSPLPEESVGFFFLCTQSHIHAWVGMRSTLPIVINLNRKSYMLDCESSNVKYKLSNRENIDYCEEKSMQTFPSDGLKSIH